LKLLISLLFLLFSAIRPATTQAPPQLCGIHNMAFKDGEEVTMEIYYTTLGMYVGAGEAKFTTSIERFNGVPVYHCVGAGKTYSFFDNFFKVRDRYESYIDTGTMLPVKFVRNVSEGNTKIYNNVTFNHSAGTATSTNGLFNVTSCIQDVVSSVYYMRNIDFSKYKNGDKIPFDMFLDDEIYHLYLRYEGKEKVKTQYGKFRAIKLKPLLIKGNVFQGGENMSVWISDDPNHLLLRAESPISVGSVKIDMMGYRNLRYPLKSLISFK